MCSGYRYTRQYKTKKDRTTDDFSATFIKLDLYKTVQSPIIGFADRKSL